MISAGGGRRRPHPAHTPHRCQPLPLPGDQAIAARMKAPIATSAAAMLLCAAPAHAIVGGAPPIADGIGRSVVTIVGSRANFCTGSLIAPALVLTVAHCVQPGADYKIVEYDTERKPELKDVKRVAIHSGFQMQAM